MKFFIQIIALIVAISTISICLLKPEMHKSVLVYNSDYKIVTEDEISKELTDIPVMEIPAQPQVQTVQKKAETTAIPKTQTSVKVINTTQQKQKPIQTVKNEQKTVTQKQSTTKNITNEQILPKKNITEQTQKTTPLTTKIQTPSTTHKVLTQQEEEIAWNVWRSNLQNRIMQDSKLPALPNGTVFRFSFNVDKYGKITNIYTKSDNPAYTPYAIQYIAPVIRSYQGKSILNFPEGSSRISTEFKGGWKISTSERFSTPQDYNDYEKVIKTY